MLKVKKLNVFYEEVQAIRNIDFEVKEAEIISLIGANGAGKSTILNTISGLIKPKSGKIDFLGKAITGESAYKIVKLGISQVPEGRKVFANLTVKENLELGAYIIRDKKTIKDNLELVFLKFPRLKERFKQLTGTLSGGEQQMLAIGRALMSSPKLLLMDEPSMGLAPFLVKEIFNIIKQINRMGTTILLVEQNAHMALSISNRAYVLETGRVIMSGMASELEKNEDVKKAYLGI